MTKLGADGRPVRRSDGKILKGPDYQPPEIAAVLHRLVETVNLERTNGNPGASLDSQYNDVPLDVGTESR